MINKPRKCVFCGQISKPGIKYCEKCGKPLLETTLVNDWLWDKHRTSLQWRRVRLGVLPNKELARMYMSMLRWADAIFIEDGQVNIVEAKIRPMPGALAQLELYKKLFKETPEFDAYKDWPVNLILLTTMLDLPMSELSSDKGISYIVYEPKEKSAD